MSGRMDPGRRCRGVVLDSGPGRLKFGPLTDTLEGNPRAFITRASHALEPGPAEGSGWVWGMLEKSALEAGADFRALEGSSLLNIGCGRSDLLSSIAFAYERRVSHVILNDIDLPPHEALGAMMGLVPQAILGEMRISCIELDFARMLPAVKANVVMNLIAGPEIVYSGASGPKGVAAMLADTVPQGGLFFGHSSAPALNLDGAIWSVRRSGGSFFATRR